MYGSSLEGEEQLIQTPTLAGPQNRTVIPADVHHDCYSRLDVERPESILCATYNFPARAACCILCVETPHTLSPTPVVASAFASPDCTTL